MFYKINGSAGTGKTTSMIAKIKQLIADDVEFLIITPTNKAAQVLNTKLKAANLPARAYTLHSRIYRWEPNGQRGVKSVRRIDPNTMKFEVDSNGNPVFREEIEYNWIRTLSEDVHDKVLLIDESSMVNSEVWYDLLQCSCIKDIWAYGDEKQLPPIEKLEELDQHLKPFYRFWHNYTAHDTLPKNHRQEGDLKTIVDAIQEALFDHRNRDKSVPVPLSFGFNFTVHASDITEEILLEAIMKSDIVITPYRKVRELVNIIRRRQTAKLKGVEYSTLPVIGDRIIFVDSIKEQLEGSKRKQVILAKNTTAVIDYISDIDLREGLMIIDFTDEDGIQHKCKPVSIGLINRITKSNGEARIDYAYAVTAHSSQGGQWEDVLFLDSYWKEDADKLRYVAVTRASKYLAVITGITNASESEDANKSILIRLAKMVKQ